MNEKQKNPNVSVKMDKKQVYSLKHGSEVKKYPIKKLNVMVSSIEKTSIIHTLAECTVYIVY